MSEAQDSKTAGAENEHSPQDGAVVAGRMLRQAREASGLHVAALAVSLKVPVSKLEALEAGRLDLLPDSVFARALASSVCRSLKVDPAPILKNLPLTRAPHLRTDETGINAPFRTPGAHAAQPWWFQLLRPVPVVVILLVIGAFVLLFLPQLRWETSSAPAEVAPIAMPPPGSDAALSAPGAMPPAPDAASAPVIAAGTVASPVPAAVPPVMGAAPAATPTPAAGPTTSASTAPPSLGGQTAGVASATATPGVVLFQPRGETWVEVKDANGVVALRKTLAAGETASASGALPLSVVVGRADSTVVEVRGKAFDLAPVSRDNVARFEVK
jgi:cytoskeleton protein RodZ